MGLYFLPVAFWAALVTLPPDFSVLATDLMTPTATVYDIMSKRKQEGE